MISPEKLAPGGCRVCHMEVDIVKVLVGHVARIKLADYQTLHFVQLLLFLGLLCGFQLKENYIKSKHLFLVFKKLSTLTMIWNPLPNLDLMCCGPPRHWKLPRTMMASLHRNTKRAYREIQLLDCDKYSRD